MEAVEKLITVICTVKNGENTIEHTIQSVINQTFKNWEFIIVDDGSTDKTNQIVSQLTKIDLRIYLITTKGIGRSNALNKAIELSKGKYIANIDADDLMHPRKLEIQLSKFEENQDYFLISTDYNILKEDESPANLKISSINKVKKIDHKIHVKNLISHSSVLMNKKKLNKIGNYNVKRKTQVDYELWLRAYMKGYKLGKIDNKLTYKRIHKNQSFENKKRIRYVFNSVVLQLKYIFKNGKYFYLMPIPVLRFIYLLLPFSVREKFQVLLTK